MTRNQEPSLDSLITGYSQILAKDPHSTVFVSLSDAYLRAGRLEEALHVAQNGVQALPWFCPGHVVLAKIQLQLGKIHEAQAAFNKALTLDGESLAALKGLAGIHVEKGQPEIARQVLERALQVYPDNSSVRHLLSQLPTGPDEEGEEADIPGGEAPISTLAIAEVFVKQGLLPQACQVYRDILQAEPGNEAIRKKLEDLEGILAGERQAVAMDSAQAEKEQPVTEGDALAVLKGWLERIRQRRLQYVP